MKPHPETLDTTKDTLEALDHWKAERGAVILAHNYQLPEVQDLADFSGDSLELARRGREVEQDVIVFAGVHFMAETAAMLSPEKTILLPDPRAGCPMADMATGEQVRAMRARYPGAVVVCYVNSTAEVKAASDVCCTSSNALEIVGRIPRDREIIFVPDRFLGAHAMKTSGREMHLWEGHCPVHNRITIEDVRRSREAHPGATLMVHPECREEVCEAADMVLSTGQMCSFAPKSGARVLLVGTEIGLLHRLRTENPGLTFVPVLEDAVCPDMKVTTPHQILRSLMQMETIIRVDERIRESAAAAVEAMFEKGPIIPKEEQ